MSLAQLPKDLIIEEITKYLNAKECYELALTNKIYLPILTNKPLWQQHVLNKINIDPNEFRDVIDDVENYHDYQRIPQVYSEIQEIQSSVCIYIYSRGEYAPNVDMEPYVVSGYNYGPDCLRKKMFTGNFDIPYVLIKNTEHNGIPEYILKNSDDYIYTINRADHNKIVKFGTIWQYRDHIYIVKI